MNRWLALLLCGMLAGCAYSIRAGVEFPVDPVLLSNKIAIRSGDGTMISGYLYRPPAQEARPAILMMHGCSGLLTKNTSALNQERPRGAIYS
jgi:poly(3-hydroxybutyrate) depolymerase